MNTVAVNATGVLHLDTGVWVGAGNRCSSFRDCTHTDASGKSEWPGPFPDKWLVENAAESSLAGMFYKTLSNR